MNVQYEAIFKKTRPMVYISHLDLMTLFRRAIRRGKLPFVLSKGFTPRVKISIPQALKLGVESHREKMSLYLTEPVEETEISRTINKELPEGVKILNINKL